MSTSLESDLARICCEETVASLGLSRAPGWVQRLSRAAIAVPSRPFARTFARFDRRIEEIGIPAAAGETLASLGAPWRADAQAPATGALLVIANHPGAHDALALIAALGRRDIMIIAADRAFLRALPTLSSRHLLLIPDEADAPDRAIGVRRAVRHLRAGGALLQFPAGRIEPDPAFLRPGEDPLGAWHAGAGLLLRATAGAGGRVVTAVVEGVHSPRVKRLFITRLAERRGITTLSMTIQTALPIFDDVDVRVWISAPHMAADLVAAERDGGPGDGGTIDDRLTGRLRELTGATLARRSGRA